MYSPLTDVPSIVSASLRSKFEAKLWKKVPWYRVVLDECQELKTATTKIAESCKNLKAVHRWMVSGTPLTSHIRDLHGELQFLQACGRVYLAIDPFHIKEQTASFPLITMCLSFRAH